jgi:hypothetical protein
MTKRTPATDGGDLTETEGEHERWKGKSGERRRKLSLLRRGYLSSLILTESAGKREKGSQAVTDGDSMGTRG